MQFPSPQPTNCSCRSLCPFRCSSSHTISPYCVAPMWISPGTWQRALPWNKHFSRLIGFASSQPYCLYSPQQDHPKLFAFDQDHLLSSWYSWTKRTIALRSFKIRNRANNVSILRFFVLVKTHSRYAVIPNICSYPAYLKRYSFCSVIRWNKEAVAVCNKLFIDNKLFC